MYRLILEMNPKIYIIFKYGIRCSTIFVLMESDVESFSNVAG